MLKTLNIISLNQNKENSVVYRGMTVLLTVAGWAKGCVPWGRHEGAPTISYFRKKLKILKNRSSETIWLTEGGDGRKSEDIKCKNHKNDLFYVFQENKNSSRQFYIISVLYCGILMIYRNGYVMLRKTFNSLNCETAFPSYLRHIWTADSNFVD